MTMDNQHRQIKGYRDLSQAEIELMNQVKAKGAELGVLVEQLRNADGLDQRWVSIGATHLQEGTMALTRAIARPTTF
jgi:molybdate-binding protein